MFVCCRTEVWSFPKKFLSDNESDGQGFGKIMLDERYTTTFYNDIDYIN